MSVRAGSKCVVNGCHNVVDANSELTFHRLPVHRPELLAKWLRVVNRPDLVPSRSMVMCGEHFSEELFQMRSGKKILKANASPRTGPTAQVIFVKTEAASEDSQSSAPILRIFADEGFDAVSANEEISSGLTTFEITDTPTLTKSSEFSLSNIQRNIAVGGKTGGTIVLQQPTSATAESSTKTSSSAVNEPTVYMIHSYAQPTDERDELRDTVVDLETQNRQLKEQLKLEREKNAHLRRNADVFKIGGGDGELSPISKRMRMSIAYIRF